jgi:hypothetical protein
MELCSNLGDWIRYRLIHGAQSQSDQAQKVLDECGFEVEELKHQWRLQKESQLSLRARKFHVFHAI